MKHTDFNHLWGRSGLPTPLAKKPAAEAGLALLEVIVASLVVGFAVVGIAVMVSKGSTSIAAGGDTRVAVRLAEQKVTHLRGLTFKCIFPGGPQAYPVGAGTQALQPGCESAAATQNYSEGPGNTWVAANGTSAPQPAPSDPNLNHGFVRKTCVQYVSDADFSTPPYLGGTDPTTANCLPLVNTSVTPNTSCGPTQTATCVPTNTKRVVVVVQTTTTTGGVRPEGQQPAVLAAWVTNVPGGL
jgi:hypothetical protein